MTEFDFLEFWTRYQEIILLGAGAGLLSTFLGLGGGILFVTFLPTFEGLDQRTAIATSLLAVFGLVLTNSIRFTLKDLVSWPIVIVIIPVAALFSFAAGRVTFYFTPHQLVLILACMLTFLFLWTLYRHHSYRKMRDLNRYGNQRAPFVRKALIGVSAGTAAGLTGIGAGSIVSAFLLNWRMVRNECVTPTSNGVMTFTSLAAVTAYASGMPTYPQWGEIRVDIAVILFGSAFIVATVGHLFQKHFPEDLRRLTLAMLILGLAIKEWFRYF